MEKNTIYEITTPNGVRIDAVCISEYTITISKNITKQIAICYGQNRLFEYTILSNYLFIDGHYKWDIVDHRMGDIICDYCVIPELDEILENITKSVSL